MLYGIMQIIYPDKFPYGQVTLRFAKSPDGGKTFGNSYITDKSACQCFATVVAIGPDNEIYILLVWHSKMYR
jgi:hypothetical protein